MGRMSMTPVNEANAVNDQSADIEAAKRVVGRAKELLESAHFRPWRAYESAGSGAGRGQQPRG